MDILGVEIMAEALGVAHLKSSLLGSVPRGYELLQGETMGARIEGLKAFIEGRGIKNPKIALALPRGAAVCGVIDIPAPDASAIGDILRYELEKHVPFPPEESYWGFDPVAKKKEKEFTVFFAAVKKSALDAILEEFRSAGLELHHVAPWQASVGNVLRRSKGVTDGSVAVMATGASEIFIDIFQGGVPVYSRSLRSTGDDRAAALKRELGAFLRSKGGPSGPKGVDICVVVSERAADERESGSLSKETGLPVVPLRPWDQRAPSVFAAPLGAALAAAGRGEFKMDLFPSSAHKSAVPAHALTLALSMAVAALLFLTGAACLVKDRIALGRMDAALAQAKNGKEKAQALADSLKPDAERVKTLEGIRGGGSPGPLEVIKELTVSLPAGTWLTDFEYNGESFTVEGYSDTASAQLLRLERSGSVRDVEFAGPVTRAGGRERFRMKFKAADHGKAQMARKGDRAG